jgi:hypothetical protein
LRTQRQVDEDKTATTRKLECVPIAPDGHTGRCVPDELAIDGKLAWQQYGDDDEARDSEGPRSHSRHCPAEGSGPSPTRLSDPRWCRRPGRRVVGSGVRSYSRPY